MTVHTRMEPRSDREKDLLKYGRRQGREQAIKVLEAMKVSEQDHEDAWQSRNWETVEQMQDHDHLIDRAITEIKDIK